MTRHHETWCARATGGRCTCGTPALSTAQARLLRGLRDAAERGRVLDGSTVRTAGALVRFGYAAVGRGWRDAYGRERWWGRITEAGRERARQMEEGR